MTDTVKGFTFIAEHSSNFFAIIYRFTEHVVCEEKLASSRITRIVFNFPLLHVSEGLEPYA